MLDLLNHVRHLQGYRGNWKPFLISPLPFSHLSQQERELRQKIPLSEDFFMSTL